jgi:PAS domain-containing protein
MAGIRAFQELLERGGRYRIDFDALFQVAPIGLAILDPDLRYLRCNDRLAEINGIAVDGHIGRTVGELLPGIVLEVEAAFRLVFSTGRPSNEHGRWQHSQRPGCDALVPGERPTAGR